LNKKIVVGISGASGTKLGLKLFDLIPQSFEKFLILSDSAKITIEKENSCNNAIPNNKIWANVASGSFGVDMMFVVPCSMNTLAKIACGISDNLITRAASVMIKEQKRLLIAPRELPFSQIALENMLKLSKINNLFIAPPVIAYYSNQQTIEDMENFLIGRWFDMMNIPNELFKRWQ
jgi:4-hydroxy-3-polyprenylbenzoate decarboxylase